jgi:2-phospho-L-lactate guanylyltransferase (CobY/MobA/RfbA family)
MTEVAIVADAPGVSTPLTAVSAVDPQALYRAMFADVLNTCERSGADVLVNVGPPDADGAMAAMEAVVAAEALEPDAVRIEPQVGADHGARVHATVDHLLATSEHRTVGVVYPELPLLRRATIDGAAMRLRSAEVVIAPDTTGMVSLFGVAEALELQTMTASAPVAVLAELAAAAGHAVAFLEMTPRVRTDAALEVTRRLLRARAAAGAQLPTRTAGLLGVGTQQS